VRANAAGPAEVSVRVTAATVVGNDDYVYLTVGDTRTSSMRGYRLEPGDAGTTTVGPRVEPSC
jgi:hypothetical protein